MPSRVIRGEINDSESLSLVSMEADLTFRALLVAVDDYGRLDARPAKLKAALYPVRAAVTAEVVIAWVEELAAIEDPPLVLYEVAGRPYLQLTGWETHRGKGRRAKESRYPPHTPRPENDGGASADIRGSSRTSAETPGDPPVGSGSGDEGRGTRDEGRKPPPSAAGSDLAKLFEAELSEHVAHVRRASSIDKWARVFDLMLRGTKNVDPIPEADIRCVIRWVVRDSFERKNVQSPTKLRDRFAALFDKATSQRATGGQHEKPGGITQAMRSIGADIDRREGPLFGDPPEDEPDLEAMRVVSERR